MSPSQGKNFVYFVYVTAFQSFVVGNRGSVLEMNVVVGETTMIGERAHVKDSVIGSRCKIGNDVTIADSFVWNNVVIKVIFFLLSKSYRFLNRVLRRTDAKSQLP